MKVQNKLMMLLIVIVSAITIILSGCTTSNPAASNGGGTGGGATVPAAPVILSATPASGQVTLSWTAVTGATSYKIYASNTTGALASKTFLGTVTAPAANHTGITNGVTYFYQVTAVNANGESAGSNEVSATPNPPGVSWVIHNYNPAPPQIGNISFLNGAWVIGGSGGKIIGATPDLTGIAIGNTAQASGIEGIAFGNGLYVAVNFSGGIQTSPDGLAWTARVPAATGVWFNGVAFGNGRFVAVGDNSNVCQTSVDGITWTNIIFPNNLGTYPSLKNVTFVNGQFIAVGYDNAFNAGIFTSPDGLIWTQQNTGLGAAGNMMPLYSVAFGAGKYVVVGGNSLSNQSIILTSPDCITWTKQVTPTPNALFGVAYGSGTFAAVGLSGTIITSPDGITWTALPAIATGHIRDITFANNRFVAVADDPVWSTQGLIISSP